jgi:3-phenylpropionate/trans-cinnamate dioxygenase ferredoxin subunit
MKAFGAGGRRVLVARVGEDWYAVDDVCSHAHASLALGDLDTESCAVTCVLHGGKFDLRTGGIIEMPAGGPLDTFEIFVEGDDVFVEI